MTNENGATRLRAKSHMIKGAKDHRRMPKGARANDKEPRVICQRPGTKTKSQGPLTKNRKLLAGTQGAIVTNDNGQDAKNQGLMGAR